MCRYVYEEGTHILLLFSEFEHLRLFPWRDMARTQFSFKSSSMRSMCKEIVKVSRALIPCSSRMRNSQSTGEGVSRSLTKCCSPMLLPKDFRELRARKMSDLEPFPFFNLEQAVIHAHKIATRDFVLVLAIMGIMTSTVSGHRRRPTLRYAFSHGWYQQQAEASTTVFS